MAAEALMWLTLGLIPHDLRCPAQMTLSNKLNLNQRHGKLICHCTAPDLQTSLKIRKIKSKQEM